jgi:hypothetical protein
MKQKIDWAAARRRWNRLLAKERRRPSKPAYLPLANSDQFATVDAGDYVWASKFRWRLHTDGHVVRDVYDEDGTACVIYLCNEVVCRRLGVPLSAFLPPRS